jgi:hypothetical protein
MSKLSIRNVLLWGAAVMPSTGCAGVCESQEVEEMPASSEQAVTIGPGPEATRLSYRFCASENGSCVIGTGGRYVAFGSDSHWFFKYFASGPVKCTQGVFGGDPERNVKKKCMYADLDMPVAQDSTGHASNQYVAYGLNGKFHFRKLDGSYTCNDATFGGSPIDGTKACYTALPGYSFKVNEGDSFDLGDATYPVAFGADGRWVYKPKTGTVTCDTGAFDGDPYWGMVKSCYVFDARRVADEYGAFDLSETGASCTVYYRSDNQGNAISKPLTSGSCTNATFGADPDHGNTKHCYAHCQTK